MAQSWGIASGITPQKTLSLDWQPKLLDWHELVGPALVHGMGRSYGDSCLTRGTLLQSRRLNHLLAFDAASGELCCEAGASLGEILAVMVPQGWFLPVSPGTQFVSLGGAIANDVHGKNHHSRGSFGCHVVELALQRSDGQTLICSRQQNAELFRATIGGLGLTGIIVWARLRLIPITSALLGVDSIKFRHIDEYFELAPVLDPQYEYSVAWLDCVSQGAQLGRGLYLGGNHLAATDGTLAADHRKALAPIAGVPFYAPAGLLNRFTVRAFNEVFFHKQWRKESRSYTHFAPYFYPLDRVHQWNRIYGRRGLLQYQFVLPYEAGREAFKQMLVRIGAAGRASFLAVLKNFGSIPSEGLLSFPRPGYTLALDFPFEGELTLKLLSELDAMVLAHGGVVYPAKDSRMSAAHFQAFYPQWRDLQSYQDKAFSSCFWERVTHES